MIDQMASEALKRVIQWINRSAAQQLRRMKEHA